MGNKRNYINYYFVIRLNVDSDDSEVDKGGLICSPDYRTIVNTGTQFE